METTIIVDNDDDNSINVTAQLCDYIRRLVPALLEPDAQVLPALTDLLDEMNLKGIQQAVSAIFKRLKSAIKSFQYPTNRYIEILEAINDDILKRLLALLNDTALFDLELEPFNELLAGCTQLFALWDKLQEELLTYLDLMTKPGEPVAKIEGRSPKRLAVRLHHLGRFRREHEQLRMVLDKVVVAGRVTMTPDGDDSSEMSTEKDQVNDLVQMVDQAYDLVKEVAVLDLSKEGSELWDEAMMDYNEKIDPIKERIITQQSHQLGQLLFSPLLPTESYINDARDLFQDQPPPPLLADRLPFSDNSQPELIEQLPRYRRKRELEE